MVSYRNGDHKVGVAESRDNVVEAGILVLAADDFAEVGIPVPAAEHSAGHLADHFAAFGDAL